MPLAVVREFGEKETSGVAKWGTAPDYRGAQIATVVGHAVKVARANPIHALRYE